MSGFLVRTWARVTAYVDAMLGRVTTYRLITLVLSALAVVALVLGAFGVIFSSPGELALSLTVILLASYASNKLWSLLWRVPTQGDSALITGLLLFFLMWPSSNLKDLGWSAAAAGIATLSKYLLRWRGRHIFNPAAFGAVVIALAGAAGAAWWVATPAMLIPVALGGLLVVRRTGRAPMVLVFLVLVIALTTARLLDSGADFSAGFNMALQSYPWVFLAVFMLTEPLTIPGRRWQRLVFAAVVAIVAALPLNANLGSVSLRTSPELALVIGNLIVMLMGARGVGRLRVVGQRTLVAGMHEVTLRPDHHRPFLPGQYLDIDVPHANQDSRGSRRTFSLTSAPGEDLTVAFRVPVRASSYKRALLMLGSEDSVRGTAIAGDFLLPRDPTTPLLLIAGGVGITPFIAHLRVIMASEQPRDVLLICAINSPAELLYSDVLAASGARVVIVSAGQWDELPIAPPANWTHHQGREIPADLLDLLSQEEQKRTAYVSGPPAMVDAVRGQLRQVGFRRIHTDVFFGY